MHDSSPGAHSVQLSPHFFSLHEPENFEDGALSPDDEPLDDELLDDELLEGESSSTLPPAFEDKSLEGSSYSTGFMRGPHAAANSRKPTMGSARGRMLGRFTGKAP
ncbi:MAG TPA: hypothetical protein VIV60_05215 [Polyangiaceae bacterium]